MIYPREALARTTVSFDTNVATLVDTAFYASLEREESSSVSFRIAYHPNGILCLQELKERVDIESEQGTTPAWYPLKLELNPSTSAFSVQNVAKMASLTRLPRTVIVVGVQDAALRIEGLARRIRRHEYHPVEGEEGVLVCTSSKPGQVILTSQGHPVFWYESGKVLVWTTANDLWTLLHDASSIVRNALLRICIESANQQPFPRLERSRYYLTGRAVEEVVQTMRATRHGGLMAVVPRNRLSAIRDDGKYRLNQLNRDLLKSYIREMAEYDFKDRETYVDAGRSDDDARLDSVIEEKYRKISLSALTEFTQNIGMLTTVDNALLLGPDLEVICAGYQVAKLDNPPAVFVVSSLDGSGERTPFALERHGSRHRAAADFAYAFAGSVVFLLSEDGELRCLYRRDHEEEVLVWNILPSVDL